MASVGCHIGAFDLRLNRHCPYPVSLSGSLFRETGPACHWCRTPSSLPVQFIPWPHAVVLPVKCGPCSLFFPPLPLHLFCFGAMSITCLDCCSRFQKKPLALSLSFPVFHSSCHTESYFSEERVWLSYSHSWKTLVACGRMEAFLIWC